jgi:hypothetical protein
MRPVSEIVEPNLWELSIGGFDDAAQRSQHVPRMQTCADLVAPCRCDTS